jgi:hypothetical protein
VERNRNNKLIATHLNRSDGENKNYLFSRRLIRDDDISPCDCDTLLELDTTSPPRNLKSSSSTRLTSSAHRHNDRKRRQKSQHQLQHSFVVDMRQQQSSRNSARYDEELVGKRKWRQHEGRNRFFCDGRVMLTRQSSVFFLTTFLIVLTFTLYCVFE